MNIEHLKTWLPHMCRRMADSARREVRKHDTLGQHIKNAVLVTEARLWDSLAEPDRTPASVVAWAMDHLWWNQQGGGAGISLSQIDAYGMGSILEQQVKTKVAHSIMSLMDQRPLPEHAARVVAEYDSNVSANRKQPRCYTITGTRGNFNIDVYDWDNNLIIDECVTGATKQAVDRWKKAHPSIVEK